MYSYEWNEADGWRLNCDYWETEDKKKKLEIEKSYTSPLNSKSRFHPELVLLRTCEAEEEAVPGPACYTH